MNAITVFTEFETMAEEILKKAISESIHMSYFTYAAILVFTVGLSLLIWFRREFKSAYISRFTTRKIFHYLFIAIPVLIALIRFDDPGTKAAWVFAVSSVVFGIVGAAGLIMRQKFGFVLSLISIWFSLPFREMTLLRAVYDDYSTFSQYNAASKAGIFAADSMILGRITALALIAAAITIATTLYYAKRRYLFQSAFEQTFGDVSACPRCQSPITANGLYCPVCGEKIEGMPKSVLAWKPLDYRRFCSECGSNIIKNGRCVVCGTGEDVQKQCRIRVPANVSGTVKQFTAFLLVCAVFLVPISVGSRMAFLTDGSAKIYNTYATYFNAWYDDSSVAEDADWLAAYDTASEALFQLNSRGFSVNPHQINYIEMYSYVQYMEASYLQMAVLQRINESVHTDTAEDPAILASYLNKTLDLQQEAIVSGLSLKLSRLKFAENLIIDSLRFYLGFVPEIVPGIVLLSIGIPAAAAGILMILRTRKRNPFIEKAAASISPEEQTVRRQKHRAFLRKERIATTLGLTVAALLFCVDLFFPASVKAEAAQSYTGSLHTVYASDGIELITWLSNCQTNPETARSDSEHILAIIDDCRQNLNVILQRPEAEKDIVHNAEDLLERLQTLEMIIERRQLPDAACTSDILSLLQNGLQIESERLLYDAFESIGEAF